MRTTIKLPKRTNATSGKKAHNDNQYIKVGRVRMNSWIHAFLPSADILISERELVHIFNNHQSELTALGLSAQAYVQMIINGFNEIRKDNRDGYLFIVKGIRGKDSNIDQCAVVEIKLEWLNRKQVYIIKTARPMSWGRLRKIEFVCDNPRS